MVFWVNIFLWTISLVFSLFCPTREPSCWQFLGLVFFVSFLLGFYILHVFATVYMQNPGHRSSVKRHVFLIRQSHSTRRWRLWWEAERLQYVWNVTDLSEKLSCSWLQLATNKNEREEWNEVFLVWNEWPSCNLGSTLIIISVCFKVLQLFKELDEDLESF